MTLNAQNGQLWVAQQSAKIGAGAFAPQTGLSWRAFPSSSVTGGVQQMMGSMPLEVNGALTPTGVFKSGYAFALEASMIPRFKSNFGHLLKMTMGAASSTANKDLAGATVSGSHAHWFTYKTDQGDIPWFAVRKGIEGTADTEDFAEFGYDCKVGSLRLGMQATNKIAANLSFQGRGIKLERGLSNFSISSPTSAAEDYLSSAEAGNATILINNVNYPLLGMTVDLTNVLTGQEEFIIGSYMMDDIIPKARGVTIRAILKIPNTDFFQSVLTGSTSGTTWSSNPLVHDTNTNYALDVSMKSSSMAVATTPFEMRLVANRVAWSAASPPLQAGNILTQEIVGTILQPYSSGSLALKDQYFAIGLGNAASAPYAS